MTQNLTRRKMEFLAGFSLIELLVSMAIGLVIMIAVMSAYLGSAGAGKMAEAQSRMNEDAQAALGILSQHIRMAGNNPDQPNRVDSANPALTSVRNPVYGATSLVLAGTATTSNFSVRGCDGSFGTFTNVTSATSLDGLTCAAPVAATPSDSIAVNYEADRYNTIAASGLPTDCLCNSLPIVTATLNTIVAGTSTAANVTYTVADNRFYVNTESSVPSLYCRGIGNSIPQPLVENVESLRFRYGTISTATTSTTATVAGYLDASEILTEANMAALSDDATRWAKVATVRICIVVRSETPVAPDAASAQYLDCSGTLVTTPPDLRLRRAYTTTVVLRNRRL
jgi:type IV pilus assembly protein PilW